MKEPVDVVALVGDLRVAVELIEVGFPEHAREKLVDILCGLVRAAPSAQDVEWAVKSLKELQEREVER